MLKLGIIGRKVAGSIGKTVSRLTYDSKAWITLASGDLIYKAVMAIYWVLLARKISVDSLGELALATAVAMPAYIALDAGLTSLLVKDCSLGPGAAGVPESHRHRVHRRLALGAVVIPFLALLGGILGGSMNAALATGFMSVAYWFDFGGQLMLSPARAAAVMTPDAVFRAVQSIGTLLLVIIVLSLGSESVALLALTSTVAYLIASGLAWRVWSRSSGWAKNVRSPSELESEIAEARLISQGTILIALNGRIDAILVQVLLGSAALAVYTVAMKLVELARLLPGALSRLVLTRVSDTAIKSYDFRAHLGLSLLFGVISAAFLLLFGPSVIGQLFGARYEALASGTVRILGLSLIPFAVAVPAIMFTLGSGRSRLLRRVATEFLLVTLAAIAALSLTHGLNGAAFGVLLSQCFAAGRFWWSLPKPGFQLSR